MCSQTYSDVSPAYNQGCLHIYVCSLKVRNVFPWRICHNFSCHILSLSVLCCKGKSKIENKQKTRGSLYEPLALLYEPSVIILLLCVKMIISDYLSRLMSLYFFEPRPIFSAYSVMYVPCWRLMRAMSGLLSSPGLPL